MNVYIDPGKHQSAVAAFQGGKLIDVFFTIPADLRDFPHHIDFALFENPRINGQTRGKRPNDMMDLAVVVGQLIGVLLARGVRANCVNPQEWKGSIKKPVHHLRVWHTLSPDERAIFAEGAGKTVDTITRKIDIACQRLAVEGKVTGYSWKAHNLLDAVGLGLWHLKRTGRAGVRFSVGRS
jgi:hypothetical protein